MDAQLLGTTLPVLSIVLEPGESVVAEAGEFSWMTDPIQMSTGDHAANPADGQPRPGAGAAPLLSRYTARETAGTIAFAARFPGSILPADVAAGREYLVHRQGFLAGTAGIALSRAFHRAFPAGIFAGEGFSLWRIGGRGLAWIQLAGDVVRFELAADRSLRVHPGHVGMFEASVVFQLIRVEGITNRYFAGDAHHFAVLSGPGTVWLQSMAVPLLAASLGPHLPAGG